MQPLPAFLLVLAMCCFTLDQARANDDETDDNDEDILEPTPFHDDDLDDLTPPPTTPALLVNSTPAPKSFRRRHHHEDYEDDDDTWADDEDKFHETLSPSFIRLYDPDYKVGDERRYNKNGQGVCLTDQIVRVTVKCLKKKFRKRHIDTYTVKNHLRRFIHQKNVLGWWQYLHRVFGIKLSRKHTLTIVKCYINAIPT